MRRTHGRVGWLLILQMDGSGSTYALEERGSHHIHLLRNGVLEIRPWWLHSGSGSSGSVVIVSVVVMVDYSWVITDAAMQHEYSKVRSDSKTASSAMKQTVTFELREFNVCLGHVCSLKVTVVAGRIKERRTVQIRILKVGKANNTLLKCYPLEILSFQIDTIEIHPTGDGFDDALL